MIEAISLETAHLLGDALPSAYRLRHRIFIERQRYEVPNWHGMEWDQFDTPAAVYLLWRDETRQVRAVARLIPTSLPYMIQQLWPELVSGGDMPSSDDVWEVTRFGIDRDLPRDQRERAFGEMFCALAEFGLRRGIREYMFVTPALVIEHAVGRAGVPWQALGEPKRLGTLRVVAARSAATEEALLRLRAHHRIEGPVLQIIGENDRQETAPSRAAHQPMATAAWGAPAAPWGDAAQKLAPQNLQVSCSERVSTSFRLDPLKFPRKALPGALSSRSIGALSMNQWAYPTANPSWAVAW